MSWLDGGFRDGGSGPGELWEAEVAATRSRDSCVHVGGGKVVRSVQT